MLYTRPVLYLTHCSLDLSMLSTPSAPAPPELSLRYAYDPPSKNVGFTPSARKALQRSFSSTSTSPVLSAHPQPAPIVLPEAVQRSPIRDGALDASHPWLNASDRQNWILRLAMAITANDPIAATKAWRGLAGSLYPAERTGALFTRRDRAGGALLLQTHQRRPRAALADAIEGLTKSSAWLALCAAGSKFSRLAVLPNPADAALVIAVEVSDTTKQKGWAMPLNEFLATATDTELDGLWAWDLKPRALDAGAVHTMWTTVRAIGTSGDEAKAAAHGAHVLARSTPVSTGHRGCRLAPAVPDCAASIPAPVPARLRCSRKSTPTPTSGSERRKRDFTPPPIGKEEERSAAKAYRAEKKRTKVTEWLDALSIDDSETDPEVEEHQCGLERECLLVFVGAGEFEEVMEHRVGSARPHSAGSAKST